MPPVVGGSTAALAVAVLNDADAAGALPAPLPIAIQQTRQMKTMEVRGLMGQFHVAFLLLLLYGINSS